MAVKSYRELIVSRKGVDLAVAIYRATRSFPREELYGLTSQVRKATVPVPSNVAEGQGRGTPCDFQRFTRIAMGSLQEAETQLIIAGRLEFIEQQNLDRLLSESDEVGRLIRGLEKSLA
jgi:four helix bundle protein